MKLPILLLISVFLNTGFLSAQNKDKVRKTIRGEFQLPRATSNLAFNKVFSGVFNGTVSFNMGGKNFSMGGFYSLTQYQIFPEFFDDPHVVFTGHTPGLRISYDLRTKSGKGMFSPFMMPGYTFIKYSRVKYKTHPPYMTESSGVSLNLGASYNIMMDEWTGVGFIVGFNMIDHVFRPENISMDEWVEFSEGDKKGSMKNIFFGFHVYFDLAYTAEASE